MWIYLSLIKYYFYLHFRGNFSILDPPPFWQIEKFCPPPPPPCSKSTHVLMQFDKFVFKLDCCNYDAATEYYVIWNKIILLINFVYFTTPSTPLLFSHLDFSYIEDNTMLPWTCRWEPCIFACAASRGLWKYAISPL